MKKRNYLGFLLLFLMLVSPGFVAKTDTKVCGSTAFSSQDCCSDCFDEWQACRQNGAVPLFVCNQDYAACRLECGCN